MSDPLEPRASSPSKGRSAQGQAGHAQQAPFGQPGYGRPVHALNPAIEKIRSNASSVRMFSYLSFLFGGMLLSGGMMFWGNRLMDEARFYGAPADVVMEVESACSTAKTCTIVHIVLMVVVFVAVFVLFIVTAILAAIIAIRTPAYS